MQSRQLSRAPSLPELIFYGFPRCTCRETRMIFPRIEVVEMNSDGKQALVPIVFTNINSVFAMKKASLKLKASS
jgi:hypothetical protein